VCQIQEINTDPRYRVLVLHGEIDLRSAPALRGRLLRAAQSDAEAIVVDLGNTTFIDSSGLNILFSIRRRLEENGSQLALVADDPSLLRTLQLTGLDRLVPIERTLGQALAHLDAAETAPAAGR
jgi:anti-anti-sigma factor